MESESFLKQKLEFLQAELEQYKKKELDHSKLNESLMLFLGKNEENLLSTHTMNEFKKTIEAQRKEIQDLKLRHKDEVLALEKERNLMAMENKELEFKIKQQRLSLDAEKLEIMNKLIKIEADKFAAEKELKTRQSELTQLQSLHQLQMETKVSDAHRKIEILKEQHLNEVKMVRQEADKSVVEIKVIYEQEIDSLKDQLSTLQSKTRELLKELEYLRESDKTDQLKGQISVLEESVEHYKALTKQSLKFEREKEDFRSFNSDLFGTKDSKYTKKEEEINLPFNPRVPPEYQKFVSEIERLRLQNEKMCKEKEEIEKKLKTEIKYLIGKLLKAKSKVSAEGELTGNLRRESMMNTLRSSGFNRTSLALRSQLRLSKE